MRDRQIKKRVDVAFKQGAIAMVRDSERSFSDIAKGLGVHVSTLRYWYDQEMAKKGTKPAITARTPAKLRADATVAEAPQEEIARLRAELKAALRKLDEVEEEKQILKKATAFFAKESK